MGRRADANPRAGKKRVGRRGCSSCSKRLDTMKFINSCHRTGRRPAACTACTDTTRSSSPVQRKAELVRVHNDALQAWDSKTKRRGGFR